MARAWKARRAQALEGSNPSLSVLKTRACLGFLIRKFEASKLLCSREGFERRSYVLPVGKTGEARVARIHSLSYIQNLFFYENAL